MTAWAKWCLAAVGVLTAFAVGAGQEPAPTVPVPVHELPRHAATPGPNPLAERLGLTPSFVLRGRLDVDAVAATQSAASKAQIGDLENGYGFRRARLGAQGTVGDAAHWVAEVDFAGGGARLRDAYVGLTAIPGLREVRVGYAREPFSLEGATSARFITFMERSPLNQLDPTRNWGVTGIWYPDSERLTFAIGAYRDGTNNGGFSGGDANNWAATTRLTGLPVFRDDEGAFRLVHLGAAFSHRLPVGRVVQGQPAPQSSLLDVSDNPVSPFLPNVPIPVSSAQVYNLQAAAVYDALSVQAEWFGMTLQQPGAGAVFVHGFYADVSYFLTGEHRGYHNSAGGFSRVSVKRPLVRADLSEARGFGAVELAARFAVADFVSPNIPPAETPSVAPTGAVLYQSTFGVNWYLNDHTRVMFNYTLAVPAAPGLPAQPIHVFGVRTAIWW